MVPRTVLHSKRWLASAAAGALLAGAAVSAQTPAPTPATLPTAPATLPTTAAATEEPRSLSATAGRPVPVRPAPQQGGLLSFLLGSNDQQARHMSRHRGTHSRVARPGSLASQHVVGAPHANLQAHHKSTNGSRNAAQPAAHVASAASADPIAPPQTFVPPRGAYARMPQPKKPGLLARLFGARSRPAHQHYMPHAQSTMTQSGNPAARPLAGDGSLTDSTLAPGQIDEATTSLVPIPETTDEMFVGVPPAPLPADVLPELPAASDFGTPEVTDAAPALLPLPESEMLPIAAAAPETASVPAEAAPTDESFELPQISPAGGAAETKATAAPEPDAPQSDASPSDAPQPEHADKFAQIAARSGNGFKGFCPVVLRDDRDLADADAKFSSTYDWREFQFSSAEAKAKFDANPEKYVPVLGGDDVVRAADGEHVAGSIEHAAWFKNRLYLFGSRESMRKFVTEPARFARDE